MDVASLTLQLTRFFSVLALVALAGAGVALASALPFAPTVRLRDDLRPAALAIAAAVAVVATLGSLYYSEVAGFVPCRFCWFQRIAMYPLAPILVIAALRRDREVWRYATPLALAGLAVSAYHYREQRLGISSSACSAVGPSCAGTDGVNQFGFITIPFMAGCGFACIAALVLLARRSSSPLDTRAAISPAVDHRPALQEDPR
ncbi:MAG: disulfide oxidoreductase [Acidimicrobiia bacterium]|nr:disulfide oxidoreductase [Acidimicrobiia bacterium]